MRVGILGGSFDPPHKGHIHISCEAIKRLNLNQVWWIPTVQNPLKSNNIANSYDIRLQNCRKFTNNFPKINIRLIKYYFAIDLVKILNRRYKNIEFYWLMGADNVENLDKWHNFKEFISLIKIAIFARDDKLKKIRSAKSWNFLKKQYPLIFNSRQINISSTIIRKSDV